MVSTPWKDVSCFCRVTDAIPVWTEVLPDSPGAVNYNHGGACGRGLIHTGVSSGGRPSGHSGRVREGWHVSEMKSPRARPGKSSTTLRSLEDLGLSGPSP